MIDLVDLRIIDITADENGTLYNQRKITKIHILTYKNIVASIVTYYHGYTDQEQQTYMSKRFLNQTVNVKMGHGKKPDFSKQSANLKQYEFLGLLAPSNSFMLGRKTNRTFGAVARLDLYDLPIDYYLIGGQYKPSSIAFFDAKDLSKAMERYSRQKNNKTD